MTCDESPPTPAPKGELASHQFDTDDQRRFALQSGDANPMHMDPLAARRLITGRQVVHGMHLLCWALETWAHAGQRVPEHGGCRFVHPVSVGDKARLHAEDARLVVAVNGQACAEVDFADATAPAPAPALADTGAAHDYSGLTAALDDAPDRWPAREGTIALRDAAAAAAAQFPHLAMQAGAARVQAMHALSYLVGMVCPGQHSIFSSLQWRWGDADAASLRFRVEPYDPRFKQLRVAFDGPLRGTLVAFVRAEPQAQPRMESLLGCVAPDEFAGSRSIVVGGSRGLGELAAKLLAAGGGDVTITYAQGAGDAQRIVEEARGVRRGRIDAQRFAVGEDAPNTLADARPLAALLYFATPRIARSAGAAIDEALLAEYLRLYAAEFGKLCAWLDGLKQGRPVRVFYPSTAYVAQRPRGMTEYAMAKAAAEVMIDDLSRMYRNVQVVCERLPRLATDQTASVLPADASRNVEVLLPLVRRTLVQPAN